MQQKLEKKKIMLGPSLFVGGEAGRCGLALEINPGWGIRGIGQKSGEDDGVEPAERHNTNPLNCFTVDCIAIHFF